MMETSSSRSAPSIDNALSARRTVSRDLLLLIHTSTGFTAKMEEGKEFYLTSVSFGMVLSFQPKGRPSMLTAQCRGDQDKAQKWTIEIGEEPNIVALKNSATGTYLNCLQPKDGGKVGLGAQQWWRYDNIEVAAPGGFKFYPVQYPGMCLNHDGGKRANPRSDGQKVHMWKWQVGQSHGQITSRSRMWPRIIC